MSAVPVYMDKNRIVEMSKSLHKNQRIIENFLFSFSKDASYNNYCLSICAGVVY